MTSTTEYLYYVLDLLRDIDNITYKKMMGEYILYCDGKIFGGIYDDRFLVKITPSQDKYHFQKEIPYKNAKPMHLVDIENPEEIKELVENTLKEL